MRYRLIIWAAVIVGVATVAALTASGVGANPEPAGAGTVSFPTPIKHVVIFMQENHSFNNLLGVWCVQRHRCTGTTTGVLSNGRSITLSSTPDVVPEVEHDIAGQTAAINGGAMNGFNNIMGCDGPQYACYSAYQPTLPGGEPNPAVQNIISLANTFAVSDRTFEPGPVPSWGEHLALVTANNLDGFSGDNPIGPGQPGQGMGWGCNSGDVANWSPTGKPPYLQEPSCIPAPAGSPEVAREPVAVRNSPAHWVPTILDELKSAGDTFRIYGAPSSDKDDYIWDVCPSFADCLYTNESKSLVPTARILYDAKDGKLPNFSLLLPGSGPTGSTSQHNGDSMAVGDNWIGNVVSAIENGPQWQSTAVFLSWDDCGCFYDEVPPPAGLGIRLPMVIISPWAIKGHTDHKVATWASILAFTEHVLRLPPLNSSDKDAYNYLGSFDFAQTQSQVAHHKARLTQHQVSRASLAWVAAHPPDPDDPT
jgi:Phosphoesterase family